MGSFLLPNTSAPDYAPDVDSMLASSDQLGIRSAIGAPDMPRIENRHVLRDFYRQLYLASVSPLTTRIGISYYGDSVAPHVAEKIGLILSAGYPGASLGYPGANSSAMLYAVTGTALTYDGELVSINQSVLNGAGGVADFTYLPSGNHKTLANGSVVTFDAQQEVGWSECRVYLATGPGFGSAFVELINRDTSATISSTTVNCTGGSLSATKAAFTGISQSQKYKIRITATGAVVVLHTTLLKPSGIAWLPLNRGGCTLTQNNFSNAAILTYLVSDMGIGIIFCSAKEEGIISTTVPATMTRLGLLTSTSKFIIGSLPDATSEATQIANNAAWRAAALAAGYTYFDGRAAFGQTGSYAELTRLGWNGDGTHPSAGGNLFVASLIMGELSAIGFPGTEVQRNIGQRTGGSYIASSLYQTFNGSGDGTRVDVLIPAPGGSGNNLLAQIQNLRKIIGGAPSGSTAVLEPGGGNWTLTRMDGNAGSLICAGITASGSSSIFPRITLGASGGPVLLTSTTSPEGVVTAVIGSICTDSVGGVAYLKKTGTGNTGWKAIDTLP